MYIVVVSNDKSVFSLECKDLKEACKVAHKLEKQFVNIQRDNEIIYNKISYDRLGNVVFENTWAKEGLLKDEIYT